MSSAACCFSPVSAATGEVVSLAMQRLWLTGQVLPAGARLTVQHIFQSDETNPIEVIYSFALPRDAALRRFRITGEGFEANSELKETASAVKTYEEGIAQGSLSTLARQHGDGVINLTVGNIRPKETVTVFLDIIAGVELRDDGFRFRFPFTLAPAYHPRAKGALIGGELERELPADEFGDVILPRYRTDASSLHQVGFDLSVASQLALAEVGSPSHPIRIQQESGSRSRASLGTEADVPDRDLVLDVRYQEVSPQILSGRDKEGKGRFAAIVPSTSFGVNSEAPRHVVILLDRSGSMGGAPIQQARKAIEACLSVLSESDTFGLVAFDNETETFSPNLLPGSRENREQARKFLGKIDARGGTELVGGVLEAARLLRPQGGGDILILTDGQVAGAEKILEQVRSANVRLHCLGIGSASQDRFLTLLARETGGVSRFVTPRERVDLSAVDLFASMGRPVASKLKAPQGVQPEPPSQVYSGTPVLLFGEAEDGQPLQLEWDGGRLSLSLTFDQQDLVETIWLLQGARLITDWEARYPAEQALGTLEKRQQSRVGNRLMTLSQTYGLASREMSLVAVVKRVGDRAGELPETRIAPVGMPQDVATGAYATPSGFTSLLSAFAGSAMPLPPPPPPPMAPSPLQAHSPSPDNFTRVFAKPAAAPAPKAEGVLQRMRKVFSSDQSKQEPETQARKEAATPEDLLLELATRMESDGGLAGPNLEARAGATLVALLAFLSQGHTLTSGAFRSHVARLLKFLKPVTGLSAAHQAILTALVESAEKGSAPAGDWLHVKGDPWSVLKDAKRS